MDPLKGVYLSYTLSPLASARAQTRSKQPPMRTKTITITKPARGYNENTAKAICSRIAEGASLRTICKDSKMPSRATVFQWLVDNEDFQRAMRFARDIQADTLADEILEIADTDPDPQRAKLRVDARMWFAGKLRPKKYGNRPEEEASEEKQHITITIGGEAPPNH